MQSEMSNLWSHFSTAHVSGNRAQADSPNKKGKKERKKALAG
jgi:hypothetical protein